MRIRSFVFPVLLLLVLAALTVCAAQRSYRSHWWLDVIALGAGVLALALVGAGAVRDLRRRKDTISKPRWYEFRVNALGVCIAMALTVWWGVRLPAEMGKGPAGPEVEASRFEKPWRNGPVRLVSIGDSVSTGFGAGDGLGYFELIRKNHDTVYPEMRGLELSRVLPNISVMRMATNSSNSLEHERVIESLPQADREVFGIVCLTTGGIDLIHPYGRGTPKEGAMYGATFADAKPWIERFEARLGRMVETLAGKFPGGCAVFIATIYDPTDDEADIENAGPVFWLSAWPEGREIFYGFNDAIKRIAQKYEHVHLVDVHKLMLGHGIHCRDHDNAYYHDDDPTYWYYANLEDPNQRGYDAIRRLFLNAMADALMPR
jgi:hypothetical protein